MQLIITQSVFVWIFGIVGVLFAIILILVIIGLVYGVSLLRLISEKSKEVAETVDVVQSSVRATTRSFDDARDNVAKFVSSAVNAGNISNIVRIVRSAWHSNEQSKTSEKKTVEDIFSDVTINRKNSTKE